MLQVTATGHVVSEEGDIQLEPIARSIRRGRLRRELSQRDLANALTTVSGNCTVDREQVARWEGSRRIPSPYWRHWLASVLDVSEQDLERAAAVSRLARSVPEILERQNRRQDPER